jgi:hypothetical protein
MELSRQERIQLHKEQLGSRLDKKLNKYSDSFNEIFTFFLQSYRKGLLVFCGIDVEVKFDVNKHEAKNTFRKFDNGDYKHGDIVSRHPNIVRAVILGKKAWGLWLNTYAEGIADWCFTKEEIVSEFTMRGITIPESLMKDFDNRINMLKMKRDEEYLKKLQKKSC